MYELGADEQLPEGPFTAYEKLDGSMGVQYPTPEGPMIATRGNFIGRQAIRASRLLEPYRDFPFEPGVTPIWEIIYPQNRLVVDYGDRNEIVLIGLVETATGKEHPLPDQAEVPFPVVKSVEGAETADDLRALEVPNAEGYVVYMQDSGLRYKVKFPAFGYLAAIRKGSMPYRVWKRLMLGESAEEYLASVPTGARDDVAAIVDDLQSKYAEAERTMSSSGKAPSPQAVWQAVRPEKSKHRSTTYTGPSSDEPQA